MSRAMDAISSEYGWTDDTILDLTLARLRQILAAIAERTYARLHREDERTEWQTSRLAEFTARLHTSGRAQKALLAEAASLKMRREPTKQELATARARGPVQSEGRQALPPPHDPGPVTEADLPENMTDRGRMAEARALATNQRGSAERFLAQTRRMRG